MAGGAICPWGLGMWDSGRICIRLHGRYWRRRVLRGLRELLELRVQPELPGRRGLRVRQELRARLVWQAQWE